MSDFKVKCIKFNFGWGSDPSPAGDGSGKKRKRGEKKEGKGQEGKGRKREGPPIISHTPNFGILEICVQLSDMTYLELFSQAERKTDVISASSGVQWL